jgi:hypothetical protein
VMPNFGKCCLLNDKLEHEVRHGSLGPPSHAGSGQRLVSSSSPQARRRPHRVLPGPGLADHGEIESGTIFGKGHTPSCRSSNGLARFARNWLNPSDGFERDFCRAKGCPPGILAPSSSVG